MSEKPVDQFQAAHLRKGEEVRQEIYRKMSFEKKLDIFFGMYRAAWKLKYEWLKKRSLQQKRKMLLKLQNVHQQLKKK